MTGAAGREPDSRGGDGDDEDLSALAAALAGVGRAVRDAVRRPTATTAADAAVVRHEGGDHVFGVDDRADAALLGALSEVGRRWPGRLVVEGHDDPVPVGPEGDGGAWVYLADPLDGTRPFLAGKRSAWVLLGAGRAATRLADLEVGAAVEVPPPGATGATVAWAARRHPPQAVTDDLVGGSGPAPRPLVPRRGRDLDRAWVTVMRFAPGHKGRIGAWEDEVLTDLEVYEDPYLCTGGLLMGLAAGVDAAVLDPRPLLAPGTMASHPYDLAHLVVVEAAGVVVEALPPGPLDVPVDVSTAVAWAAYANEEVASVLRPRVAAAG